MPPYKVGQTVHECCEGKGREGKGVLLRMRQIYWRGGAHCSGRYELNDN